MRKPTQPRKPSYQLGSKKEQLLIKWLDVFMERYGMSYNEFMELPIPTFYALAGLIIEENEENQKRMK